MLLKTAEVIAPCLVSLCSKFELKIEEEKKEIIFYSCFSKDGHVFLDLETLKKKKTLIKNEMLQDM